MLPLKEATSSKHDQAEKMPFNMRMFKGQLSKEQYLLYLNQQLPIFQTIENIGLPHESLKRSSNIHQDIDELKAEGANANLILKSTQDYVDYLGRLSYEQLLPHIYLNYLAIMFGGQIMKKTVPSSGRMYDFDDMKEALQSVRQVQKDEWAEEVNKGFDFAIQLFAELEDECIHGQSFSTA